MRTLQRLAYALHILRQGDAIARSCGLRGRERIDCVLRYYRMHLKPKAPKPEPCCPKCEAIARAHGWTEASGMSVRAYMTAHGLKED